MGGNGTIYTALLAAKQAMSAPRKNSTNPHFKSKYADLSAVMEAAIPALHQAGIVIEEKVTRTAPESVNDETVILSESQLEVSLVLASNPEQRITSRWPLKPERDTAQAMGSALTYGRRYLLQTMCGLSAEDDDGNAATQPPKPKPVDKPKPKPEPPKQQKPVAARVIVNTELWKQLWGRALAAGMDPAQVWDAVFARRDDLKCEGQPGKGEAARIVAQLTEQDFIALNEGVNAMRAAMEAEQTEYDPETGECREPGSDDEG